MPTPEDSLIGDSDSAEVAVKIEFVLWYVMARPGELRTPAPCF